MGIRLRGGRDERDERGIVSGIVLIVFVVLAVTLLSIYNFVLMDYVVASNALETKQDSVRQSNIVESLRANYKTSMRNDVSYTQMESVEYDKEKANQAGVIDFGVEYRNYTFDYVKKTRENGSVVDATRRGEFGRFNWVKFLNYQSVTPTSDIAGDTKLPYRHYDVNTNWDVKDKSGVYEESSGALLLPDHVVLKIDFDEGVSRARVRFGNSFEYVENDFINRTNGKDVFELSGIPKTVSWIEVEADEPLGSTSFSLLKEREIDVLVYKKGSVKAANKLPVLKKTLKVSLAKNKLVTSYVSIGTEGIK